MGLSEATRPGAAQNSGIGTPVRRQRIQHILAVLAVCGPLADDGPMDCQPQIRQSIGGVTALALIHSGDNQFLKGPSEPLVVYDDVMSNTEIASLCAALQVESTETPVPETSNRSHTVGR